MTPEFDRKLISQRIIEGLAKAGPSPLERIYGFCGAVQGGQQHFVRQDLKWLALNAKVRRHGGDLYASATDAPPQGAEASETPKTEAEAETEAPAETMTAPDEQAPEAPDREADPSRRQAPRGAFRAWVLQKLSGFPGRAFRVGQLLDEAVQSGIASNAGAARQALAKVVKSGELTAPAHGHVAFPAAQAPGEASAEPEPEPEPEPRAEASVEAPAPVEPISPGYDHRPVDAEDHNQEEEPMQTQANGSADARPQPLKDFIVTLLDASDAPMSIEQVTKAALKKGVTKSHGSVSVTLAKMFRGKEVARPEVGMYAGLGAEAPARKGAKRTAGDIKKAAERKRQPRPRANPKAKRAPSLLQPVYADFDERIAAAADDEKAAAEGIRGIDAQMKKLKADREALADRRSSAQDILKKLRGKRQKVAELEAGIAQVLKA